MRRIEGSRPAIAVIAGLLLALVPALALPARATPATATVDGLTYALSGSTAEVTGCSVEDCTNLPEVSGVRTLAIPPTITVSSLAYDVVSVAMDAFNAAEVRDVVVGDRVTAIGFNAFGSRHITGVALGSAVETIDDQAFGHSGLSGTVALGRSVRSVGPTAFVGTAVSGFTVDPHNPNLTAIDGVLVSPRGSPTTIVLYPPAAAATYAVPSGITAIGTNAFSSTSVTTVTLPASMRDIGLAAFEYSSLSTLVLNDGLTTLRNRALADTALSGTLTIPSSVTFIAPAAFAATNITAFDVSDENTTFSDAGGALYRRGGSNPSAALVACPAGRTAPLVVADGTEAIDDQACMESDLTEAYLPSTVRSLGDMAFYDASSLAFLAFAGNAPTIGSDALTGIAGTARTYAAPEATGFPVGGVPHASFAVASATPASGLAAGTAVTVSGDGFGSRASVTVGGTAATSTRTGTTQLAVTAPAGSGTVDLEVRMPAGIVAGRTSVTYQPAPSGGSGSSGTGASEATSAAPSRAVETSSALPPAPVDETTVAPHVARPVACSASARSRGQRSIVDVASGPKAAAAVRATRGTGLRVTGLAKRTRYCVSLRGQGAGRPLGWAASDAGGALRLATAGLAAGATHVLAFAPGTGTGRTRYVRVTVLP